MARERDILTVAGQRLAWVSLLVLLCLPPSAAHGASLLVSWVPNAEDDLAGYWIHYGTASGDYTESIRIPKDALEPLDGELRYRLYGLKPATTYYVALTAYDIRGNVSDYSDEDWCTTASSETEPEGCFIATAAYGSRGAQVAILRRLRDDFLLTNRLGRAFVELYYTYSPPLAGFIVGREWLRATLRPTLYPLVALALFLRLPLSAKALILLPLLTLALMLARLGPRPLQQGRRQPPAGCPAL